MWKKKLYSKIKCINKFRKKFIGNESHLQNYKISVINGNSYSGLRFESTICKENGPA